MPVEGQWERQQTSLRRLSRRELRMLLVVCGVLAATFAGTVLYAVLRAPEHVRAGCVEVTAPSTTGAARYRACGARAASWCREEAGRTDPLARAVQARCRALRLSRRPARP